MEDLYYSVIHPNGEIEKHGPPQTSKQRDLQAGQPNYVMDNGIPMYHFVNGVTSNHHLPPIGTSSADTPIQNGNNGTMKVGIENNAYENENDNGSQKRWDPDSDPNPGPAPDAPVDFNPAKKPIPFCSFIVKHYKLAFFLTLAGHIFFVVVSGILIAAGYDLLPLNFEGVPMNIEDDKSYIRWVAWRHRDEDTSLLKPNTSAAFVGERTKNADILQIFFEDSNVLEKAKLMEIQKLEGEIHNMDSWKKYCKQDSENLQGGCMDPISLIRFFDGTYGPNYNDTKFDDIPGTLKNVSEDPRFQSLLDALVGKTADISEPRSKYTRIVFFTGLPLAGYDLSSDDQEDQLEEIKDFLVDELSDKLKNLYEDGLGGMNVYYSSYQLLLNDVFDQVIKDLMLAVGSILFIFVFMLFQTGSLFLTSFAIGSVLTSFLGANLIYRVVFDFKYFGIFHVLSIFIILGIGADNIFVFNDTWRATSHEKHANLEERLSSCYRRASKSMAITSLTTFAAFISNAFSPLLAVNTFGIFSSILVLVNFMSAIIFFPTCVMLHHKKYENWTWPCFRACNNTRCYPCAKKDTSKTGHRPNAVVRFFRGPYHKAVTNKYTRWIFIIACTAVLTVFLYYMSEVDISSEEIQLYKEGTNHRDAAELNLKAFKVSLDDRNIKVMVSFGMKEQDLSDCHKTDYECKGKTVWDNSFDLNPKPAQIELLDFCKRMKTLQGYPKLKLEKNAVTNETEIKCFVEVMDTYMTREGKDGGTYPANTDLSLPTSELKYTPFFSSHPNLYNQSHVHENFYRYFEQPMFRAEEFSSGRGKLLRSYFLPDENSSALNMGRSDTIRTGTKRPKTAKSYWLNNGYNGSFSPDYGEYSILIGETTDKFDTQQVMLNSTSAQYFGTRLRYAGIEIRTTVLDGTLNFVDGLDMYDAWEEFITQEMTKMPSSAQGVMFATGTNAFHQFKMQEALVDSAVQGVIIGLCLALTVITIATMNIVISLMATATIACVTLTIAGSIPVLGWEISVIESINLSLVVGLAVDYVVHLSESYHHSAHHDRVLKVRDMLENMGISVLSGAFSTLGASAFMIGAQIQFFIQFGIFMFTTIGFSLLYSLCLFTAMLGLMGPQGHFGSLTPLVKRVWYKIIGRGKNDPTCEECKGKGFIKEKKEESHALNGGINSVE